MTFEEWFVEEFSPQFAYSNDDPAKYESAARQAWEASRRICFEEAEIVLANTTDSAKYSLTPMRLHFFSMGAEVFLRDLKIRLRY